MSLTLFWLALLIAGMSDNTAALPTILREHGFDVIECPIPPAVMEAQAVTVAAVATVVGASPTVQLGQESAYEEPLSPTSMAAGLASCTLEPVAMTGKLWEFRMNPRISDPMARELAISRELKLAIARLELSSSSREHG
jgi:hypothetical protein